MYVMVASLKLEFIHDRVWYIVENRIGVLVTINNESTSEAV